MIDTTPYASPFVTMFPRGIRDVVDMTQFAQPDPRDARIAELEAALREVRKLADVNDGRTDWKRLQDAGQIARTALMPSPERDMKMAQEELEA